MNTVNPPTRRGSVYVLVLGASMLVTVIGLTAVFAMRVEQRSATMASDQAAARLLALAAVEMGTYWMNDDPDWRINRPHGAWATDFAFADGTFSLAVTDPVDSDLSDSTIDPIIMVGIGKRGDSRHLMKVRLDADVPDSTPALDVVGSAIHGDMALRINPLATLTATGAPATTNGTFKLDGTMVGDLEAESQTGTGTHLGTATVPAPAKDLPDPGVFDTYVARATTLVFTPNMDIDVIAPGYNSYSPGLNADGVYYINTGGADLVIEDSRIFGTLLIDTGGGTVTVLGTTLMQPYRADYPTLMVKGHLVIEFLAGAGGLDEAVQMTNFNPDGAPYLELADADQIDVFPSRIEGLVYCTGNLTNQTFASQVNGSVVCVGTVVVDSNLTVNHNADLVTSPVDGFTQDPASLATMAIARGSWQQMVE